MFDLFPKRRGRFSAVGAFFVGGHEALPYFSQDTKVTKGFHHSNIQTLYLLNARKYWCILTSSFSSG